MQSERQMKILELISQHDIETQDELAAYLTEAGFKTTQATISRDIRTLKLTKVVDDSGHFKYVAGKADETPSIEKYKRVLRDGYLSMDQAENIVVLHTVPGLAMAAAASVDAMNWSQVAGVIAGDDTIFCAVRSDADIPSILKRIDRIVRG